MSAGRVSISDEVESAVSPDIAAISRIDAVSSILEVCCKVTGMGFAAVARVTPEEWTACAVRDEIGFGLPVGGELPVRTTLCDEVRGRGETIVFDNASLDPVYKDHHTPRTYGLESYISVPIVREGGAFFGTLCAIDPAPNPASKPETVAMFQLFAQLIATQLDAQDRLAASEAALTDASDSAELRDQFIAVLGHDLRNPLAAIEAGTTLLDRSVTDDKARGVLSEMRASTGRMKRLIDDVLDFARGRLGGGLPVSRRSAVALESVLSQVVAELRAAHPEREMKVDLEVEHAVSCDPDRISQLLSNLLANALTHGDPDAPVRVRAFTSGDAFELSVSNAGAPISERFRSQLFKPFNRPASGQRREGLGLGLYIAAQIAEAHGGSLQVSSTPEETRFTFTMAC